MRLRYEIASGGIDDSLAGVGGDPYRSIAGVGLRVPTLATALVPPGSVSSPNALDFRYLFLLASITLGEGSGRFTLRGFRQLVSIGLRVSGVAAGTHYVNELNVTSPFWHFSDGDISWHFRRIDRVLLNSLRMRPQPLAPPIQNLAFLMGSTPALLYRQIALPAGPTGKFYTNLTAYQPPARGQPWGNPMDGLFGTFYDLKTPYTASQAWNHSLDIGLQGPATYAFFASVRQSDPSSRPTLTAPTDLGSLSPEERFIQAFPNAIYWRIGGAMIIEEDR